MKSKPIVQKSYTCLLLEINQKFHACLLLTHSALIFYFRLPSNSHWSPIDMESPS